METQEEKPQRIKLRGHHLAVFALDNWPEKDCYNKLLKEWPKLYRLYERTSPENIRKMLRERRLSKTWWCFWKKSYTSERIPKKIISEYGETHINKTNALWDLMKSNPDLEVEIVEGLDDICQFDCHKKLDSCSKDINNEDLLTLYAYCLTKRKVYTSKQIIEKISEYIRINGITSPREEESYKKLLMNI